MGSDRLPGGRSAGVQAAGEGPVGAVRRSRVGGSRRSLAERVTPAMIVGLLLALLSFVLVAAVLRDRREMTTALVPVRVISAGEALTAESVEVVKLPKSVEFSAALISEADLASGSLVAGRVLPVGEPITRSAVGSGSARAPVRVIALPLAGWGAAGGELEVGDQVDVVDTRSDATVYVVQGATVIDRSAASVAGSPLGSASNQVWVSIEVTEEQALQIAAVVEADKFVLVRSTGVTVGP